MKIQFTRDILELWDKNDCVKFAIWCVDKVLPIWVKEYPDDTKLHLVVEAAKIWINSATEENVDLVRNARRDLFALRNQLLLTARTHAPIKAADVVLYLARAVIVNGTRKTKAGMTVGLAVYWVAIDTLAALGRHDRNSKDLLDEYMRSLELNTISLYDLNKGL